MKKRYSSAGGSLLAKALAFLFFSTYAQSQTLTTPPTSKLEKPVVLLISADGFRFGYQYKTETPNIDRLIAGGTEADMGLIPVFPSETFPNHYSIVTGLYPESHGIVNNYFVSPEGKIFNKKSTGGSSLEPGWWLGEPLWETAVGKGLNASSYFWPGSEVKKNGWHCLPEFCPKFDPKVKVPFQERVETVLDYFNRPDEMPSFMTLYFQDPDAQGHKFGPDDPRITESITDIDNMIGMLIDGLVEKGMFEKVHMILVGDHGMVGMCSQRNISLDDFKPWITIPKKWIQSEDTSAVLFIRPTGDLTPAQVVAKMKEALDSGKIENGKFLDVYLKEDFPERLHYSNSERISPIVGIAAEGFQIVTPGQRKVYPCGGGHGYDNALFSMRSIFIGHGPRFKKGFKVPSFENVEIYNMVTSILRIEGAPNNGTPNFVDSVLKPEPKPSQSPEAAPLSHPEIATL